MSQLVEFQDAKARPWPPSSEVKKVPEAKKVLGTDSELVMGTLFFMLGLAVLPLLAFGYGIYRGGGRYAWENLLALLIPAGLAAVYLAAPRFNPGRPGDPAPEVFLAAVFSLALTGYLLFRAHEFMFVSPPGICSCGYNLTGNTSGICPECGRSL